MPGRPVCRFAFSGCTFGQDLFKNGEYPLTQAALALEILQSSQLCWNVVTRFGINGNGGDFGFTEFELGLNDVRVRFRVTKILAFRRLQS